MSKIGVLVAFVLSTTAPQTHAAGTDSIIKTLVTNFESLYSARCPDAPSEVRLISTGYYNDPNFEEIYRCGELTLRFYVVGHEFTRRRHLSCFDIELPKSADLVDSNLAKCRN